MPPLLLPFSLLLWPSEALAVSPFFHNWLAVEEEEGGGRGQLLSPGKTSNGFIEECGAADEEGGGREVPV